MKTKRFLSLTACLGLTFFLTAAGLFADHHFQVERQFIYPDEFKPGKAYSPGVLVGETLYIAGQIDKDPQTGAQARRHCRADQDGDGQHGPRPAGGRHGLLERRHLPRAARRHG